MTGFHQLSRVSSSEIDVYELKVAKVLVDSLLERATPDVVKKYKFQKINGLRIDGAAEIEINEIVKAALMQVMGWKQEIVDQVVIPAVLTVEK